MKSLKKIGSVLCSACVCFSVCTLLAQLAIILFLDPARDGLLPLVTVGIFGFSLMFSWANYIYFKTELNTLVKYFIHLFMTVGSAVALCMIPGKSNGAGALFIGVCLAVIHILFFLIYNVRSMGRKKEEYSPVYDKLKKD